MSHAVPRLRRRSGVVDSSGSWSDVSDCESASPRANVNKGRKNADGKARTSAHQAGAISVKNDDSDNEERLTKSLELDNGMGELQCNDPQSLPSDTGWNFFSDSPSRSSSLPPSGFYAVHDDMDTANGFDFKRQENEQDQAEKIKNKLMSAWNNVRHGWTVKMKTNFSYDSEIWFLGRLYHNTLQEREAHKRRLEYTTITAMEKFKRDFTSKFWFTYRQDFPCLQGTQLTSDVGWGCMLRSGQMLLCQALSVHFLGREWRWYPSQKKQEVIYHRQLIRYFGDLPSDECPFSLHKLVQYGLKMSKKPGDWYGPASVAFVLKEAMDQAPNYNPLLGQVCLYVAQDCTVYKQDVIDLCTKSSRSRTSRSTSSSAENSPHHETPWRPIILLIPVRLGGESFNTYYTASLQHLLQDELCIGIMGGKPKHSVFFVGWQEDKLIYLDPHFCQDNVNVLQKDFDLNSYHCMSPRKMPFCKMDPSCTIGFYCQTRTDLDTVERLVLEAHKVSPCHSGIYPMFVFADGHSCDVSYQGPARERYLRVMRVNKKGQIKQPSKESEDFVFL